MNERSFVVAVGITVAAGAGLVFTLGGGGSNDTMEGSASEDLTLDGNAAEAFEGGPDEVLLLSGTTLVRRNVEEQTEDVVGEIPSPNVYAAPGSSWLAYVTTKKRGPDDVAAPPVLTLYDADTEKKAAYGAGVAPVWNPPGTHVAFLRPVEPRDCVGEACSGDVQVGVIEAETGAKSVLLEPGSYTILGWSGNRVFVSDFYNPAQVISVSLDDERRMLDMPASQFWEAAPDGRWVIKTNAKKTEFISTTDGGLGKERIPVELGEYELLEGSWSHDSSTVAVVTRIRSSTARGGKKRGFVEGESTTQVMTFSPESPELELVPRTYGATGTVLWAPDNEAIVVSTLLNPSKALYQARHCPLANSGTCSVAASWTEGVLLLRAE